MSFIFKTVTLLVALIMVTQYVTNNQYRDFIPDRPAQKEEPKQPPKQKKKCKVSKGKKKEKKDEKSSKDRLEVGAGNRDL